MKPFDLQAALAGAKVVTRDGREVKIAGYNEEADTDFKIAGWVDGEVEGWTCAGKFSESIQDAEIDLFMAPTGKKEWVVRYDKYDAGPCYFGPFETLKKAEKYADYEGGTIHEITIIE